MGQGRENEHVGFCVEWSSHPALPWISLEVWSRDKEQGADGQSCVECSKVSASLNI